MWGKFVESSVTRFVALLVRWCPMGPQSGGMVEIHLRQIQDVGRRPNWKRLNRYNSAADCPISLKFAVHNCVEHSFVFKQQTLYNKCLTVLSRLICPLSLPHVGPTQVWPSERRGQVKILCKE